MVINRIGGPSFGMKYSQQEMWRRTFGDEIIARQTRDIIELDNGKTVVIGTRYEGGKIVHKVTTLWDNTNNMLKAVIREWFFGQKKPSKYVLQGEALNLTR